MPKTTTEVPIIISDDDWPPQKGRGLQAYLNREWSLDTRALFMVQTPRPRVTTPLLL